MMLFNVCLLGGSCIAITTIISIFAYDKGVKDGKDYVDEVIDEASKQIAKEMCEKYNLY